MNGTILDLDHRYIWHPYTQEQTMAPPVVAVRGSGAYIEADDGQRYLDLVSSWWTNLHGHSEPAIARAIAEQAAQMEQVIFADFTHVPAVRLAQRLAGELPGDLQRVFYSDDGSTSVEVAIKMALQYFLNRGQGSRNQLLAFEGSYHGDTVGAMSLGRTSGYFHPWEPLLFPVGMLPFPATWIDDPDVEAKEKAALDALEKALTPDVAAVIIEPLIQGAGGMRMCRPEFLSAMAERIQTAGSLLIFDEVMTGFGRTGDLFACLKANVVPDFVCFSKGITGGFLPMAATVVREPIHEAFLGDRLDLAFLHGHSYTANPLGCAAGLASLDLLTTVDCRTRIAAIEAIHRERILGVAGKRPRVTGTVAAIDLGDDGYASATGPRLKAEFRAAGMLLRPLGPVVYFLPPYCISPADLHRAWDLLERLTT